VIVEAPRLFPRRLSRPAAMIATGSKPEFSQNVLSSTAVWASLTIGGMSLNSTTSRCCPPNLASSTLPVRSVMTDCCEKPIVSKVVTGGSPVVIRANAETMPTAPRKARIAKIAQITRAIQPAGDGDVRRGASRTGPRSARGASYT
jgi:hypothetical protein